MGGGGAVWDGGLGGGTSNGDGEIAGAGNGGGVEHTPQLLAHCFLKSLHCPHCALCRHEWPSHDRVSSGYMISHRSVHGFWYVSSNSRGLAGAPNAPPSTACMRAGPAAHTAGERLPASGRGGALSRRSSSPACVALDARPRAHSSFSIRGIHPDVQTNNLVHTHHVYRRPGSERTAQRCRWLRISSTGFPE